ncbi:glycosyltransferase family protein [Shumkonia mesophila]|uniref:hypothetical protein n=1 Tax=Shumkonia mesophila TaxID=2838854 RepID=UPI0029350FC5|nr:hypothetical protein [Shumkonia mesophila]
MAIVAHYPSAMAVEAATGPEKRQLGVNQIMNIISGAVDAARRSQEGRIRYSICTLVNKEAEYDAMVRSFMANGFREPDCEFLYLDNTTTNRFDGFSGCNLFLNSARGDYVILCHQDVQLLEDGIERLNGIIAELDRAHPDWGLFGNAGARADGTLAIRISDPFSVSPERGTDWGPFPAEVQSLDENFIVVKRAANLAVSGDLGGFHLFGTDLCLNARSLGYRAFVVNFLLRHKSPGNVNADFRRIEKALIDKYANAWKPRWVTTTCTLVFLSGWRWLNRIGNSRVVLRQMLNLRKRRRRARREDIVSGSKASGT